jgi:aspartate aminotransferase
MEIAVAHMLSRKVAEMKPSATIAMAQKARDLIAKGYDIISLSLGEPDFGTPVHIIDAAKKALDEGYTKYTPVPGHVIYRKAIIEKFKRDNDLHFDLNQIVVSNGAKQSIANVCQAILNEGDEVIIFAPYWVSYYEIVKYADGVPIVISADIDKDFKVTPDQLARAINHKTKAILFSSPCNPTGSVYTKEELEQLANVISKHKDVIVISDEIYEYINFSGKHASIGAIDSLRDRTVTVNGMSKGFAMTGWRLGYMGAPKWIASACEKVQSQVTSGAASFSQIAAAEALLADLSPTIEMTKAFEKRKKLVLQGLGEIPGLKLNDPKGAFYVFPDVSEYFGKTNGKSIIDNADDFCEVLLEEAHVATVSGSAFGDDNCFRISYAASEEELIEAIKRIKNTLATYY